MITKMLKEMKKCNLPTEEIEQTLVIAKLANVLSSQEFQIAHGEVDDYGTVIFNINNDGKTYNIEMFKDCTFDIFCEYEPFQMCDEVYGLMKDLFTPIRYKMYELHKNKMLAVDKDDDFDYSEELIELGLDDDSDDTFCYVFN